MKNILGTNTKSRFLTLPVNIRLGWKKVLPGANALPYDVHLFG